MATRKRNLEKESSAPSGTAAAPRRKTAAPRPKRATPKVKAPAEAIPARPAELTYEEVARLAYSYWLEGGCQEGSAEEDWLRAEKALRSRAMAAAS